MAWIFGKNWRQLKKELVAAMYGAAIYHTWEARNWNHYKYKFYRRSDIERNERKDNCNTGY